MNGLTAGSGSLLDLIDMPDEQYAATRAAGTASIASHRSSRCWTRRAASCERAAPGHNVLRYLMLRMHNQVIKAQYTGSSVIVCRG